MHKLFLIYGILLVLPTLSYAEVLLEKDSPVVQGETLKENIGIRTVGGELTPILKIGCKLPCLEQHIFSTAEDNQERLSFSVFRGASKFTDGGVSLGKIEISGIRPAPRNMPNIKIVFGATNGNIWVDLSTLSGKSNIKINAVE